MEDSDYLVGALTAFVATVLIYFHNTILALSTILKDFMLKLGVQYAYFGAFLVSLLGNSSIIVPIPYAPVVFFLGSQFDPFLIGLFSGLGASIGEMTSYFLGRGISLIEFEKKYKERLEKARHFMEKSGFWIIFLFSFLPIPDDIIILPAGILGYNVIKIIFWSFLGKSAALLILAYSGRFSWNLVAGLFGTNNAYEYVIVAVGMIVVSYLTVRVDWTAFVEKGVVDTLSELYESLNIGSLQDYFSEYPFFTISIVLAFLTSVSAFYGFETALYLFLFLYFVFLIIEVYKKLNE
ncbi:MAG: YqaA family protein [Candidatus Asgardarchaeia archaeon]